MTPQRMKDANVCWFCHFGGCVKQEISRRLFYPLIVINYLSTPLIESSHRNSLCVLSCFLYDATCLKLQCLCMIVRVFVLSY